MPTHIIYTLPEADITVTGTQLSGLDQGDGSHLIGNTITLNSNAWQAVSVEDDDNNFADNDSSQTLTNAITYGPDTYSAGTRVESEFAFTVTDPDGNEYRLLAFNLVGPTGSSFATVEGIAFVGGQGGFPPIGVTLTVTNAFEGPSDAVPTLATPVCFVQGARLATPQGWCRIEDLQEGDLVLTRDAGAQPVRWIGMMRYPQAALAQNAAFRPISIRRDAFGRGCPARDIALSPQHRVLIEDWRAEIFCGTDEVLVPIKKLVDHDRVHSTVPRDGVAYYHVLFDAHHIVDCEGLPCESLQKMPAHGSVEDEMLQLSQHSGAGLRSARMPVTGPMAQVLATAFWS